MEKHNQQKCIKARLAPSPTGHLHLGNAWSFLIAWLACRLENGNIYLRMEDIDPQRSKEEFAQGIVEDLSWLGLDWDIFIDKDNTRHAALYQSNRYDLYKKNLQIISSYVYKCYCTRKELREMAGAPQSSQPLEASILQAHTSQKSISKNSIHVSMPDIGASYNGQCRYLTEEERVKKEKKSEKFCLRLACPNVKEDFLPFKKKNLNESVDILNREGIYSFQDLVLGEQIFSLKECGGDFALKRSDGVWAYQLAVVSDDIDMGINQIVRGNDILMSTPRQLYLYELLGAEIPQYAHIPLLLDEKGDRLAKRHKSLSIARLREKEKTPKNVITYLAHLMGFSGEFAHAMALLEHIKLQLPKNTKPQFPWKLLKKASQGFNAIKIKNLC